MKFKLSSQSRPARTLSTAVFIAILIFIVLYRLEDDRSPLDLASYGFGRGDSPPPAAQAQPGQLPPTGTAAAARPNPVPTNCPSPALKHLKKPELNLSDTITYSRRCIKPVLSTSVDRDVVANISDPLFTSKTEIDLTSCDVPVHLDKCDPLPLRVPSPHPKSTYPHLIFGVATSYQRFKDSLGPFSFWLSGSRAKLVGIVSDAFEKDHDLEALEALYAESDIEAHFVKPMRASLTVSENHFTIIRDLVRESKPETQWIGILDDDTFFPSLHRLSAALDTIDHTQHAYVGALSEDFKAVRNFGYMAFGGAGVFLSPPLARHLEPKLEQCLDEAKAREGDALIRDCVYRQSHTKLTILPDLHQMDIAKDAAGFYEGGRNPLSLHHWKSWYHSPVALMAAITHVCGDCFLQRWRMGEKTVLTNGYSVVEYRDGLRHLELDKMEATWSAADSGYDFSIGPLRSKMPPEKKKSYKLLDAEMLPDGGVRQTYVHKGPNPDDRHEVMELIWEASRVGVVRSRPG